MTEAEWMACDNPAPLLGFLQGKVSDRKLRLFAVACCRRVWSLLPSQTFRDAVEMSERFADGLASDDKLRKARSQARESASRQGAVRASPWSTATQSRFAKWLVVSVCSRNIHEAFQTGNMTCVVAGDAEQHEANLNNERRQQAHLLRDIFGNPFRPAVVNSSWRTFTVLALAEGIYANKAFDRLPILADALQDAGCDSDDLLSHLRNDGPHVRGCWALDLVLGKS
ncbi:Uncharacterized protein OS=Sorangium cellulosum (strain So ce56) GN=sce5710 PE=4 SV=1 [Gemmata massiliana]|uniref:SMI1/KNR4 family protein n=1 Tax=Gemmata massiliana TaxID=1210884 RepID=A0A6P2DAB4_9BACT|nr:hypothetical protein [Gemmata massiliana]VTR97506.1 Uncharacterized protein OS=Sorangium cellulosum (strain So ce56) GN=sce5710 PE=4 SV=1 [Gemmata massiliana]